MMGLPTGTVTFHFTDIEGSIRLWEKHSDMMKVALTRLMDELKEMGIVGREQTGGKTREVLIQKGDDPIGRRARIIEMDEEED